MPLILQRFPGQSYLRLGHSPALFFMLFGHDGAPSLPQSLKNIARRLTALRLTFIVEPALRRKCDMRPTPMIKRLIIFARQPMRCVSDEILVTLNPNTQ